MLTDGELRTIKMKQSDMLRNMFDVKDEEMSLNPLCRDIRPGLFIKVLVDNVSWFSTKTGTTKKVKEANIVSPFHIRLITQDVGASLPAPL